MGGRLVFKQASRTWLQPSPKTQETWQVPSPYSPYAPPQIIGDSKEKVSTCRVPWILGLPPRKNTPWQPNSAGKWCLCAWVKHNGSKVRSSSQLAITAGLSAQGLDRNVNLPVFPETGIWAYFKSCFLKMRLPISLNLGANYNRPLCDTDALNYWKPQKYIVLSCTVVVGNRWDNVSEAPFIN